ncbi:MAG: hypothetical protein DRJ01_10925 [Bacteroidetes bacterium]|nr:MAG: hypothetical protein DRJ01_10925 [Bacteroidota bacterium]
MTKILYILSHPIQYQSPLLKKMAEQKNIDLKVLYLTKHTVGGIDKQFRKKINWDTPLFEGYKYEFVKNSSLKPAVSGSFWGLVNWSIVQKIRKEKPEIVIVHGWTYFTNWLIYFFSFLFKAKIWMRAESPLNQELKKRKIVLLIKKIALKFFLFKIIDKFLYIGTQNKNFYKYYGVNDEKLIFAPYAVDNNMFFSEYEKYKDKKNQLKAELGIPTNNKILLSVGKYMKKKNPLDIIEAFSLVKNSKLTLIMLGEGELRQKMEDKIKKDNIKNVILTGFINQSEISKYYAVADVLILASTIGETWGLVVNEAMNFGLPVVCSDMPGSAYDLIEHGKNGFIFKTGNIDELKQYIEYVIENEDFCKNAISLSLNRIKDFSYDVIVENINSSIS